MPAALITLALAAWAQQGPPTEFTPHVEVRGRAAWGYTEGLSRGVFDESPAFTRARLGLELQRAGVSANASLQGWQGWAWEDPPNRDPRYRRAGTVELEQAWMRFETDLPGGVGAEITLGRQYFVLHDGRLVSDNDWMQRGQPLDAFRLDVMLGTFRLRVFNFRDYSTEAILLRPGSSLITLGLQDEGPVTAYVADLVLIGDNIDGVDRVTTGGYVSLLTGRFDGGAEGYAQTEIVGDGDVVPSVLASVWAGWTFGPERLVHTHARYDFVGPPTNDAVPDAGGFSRPAGEVYRFNGHLNLFVRPADTDFRGLQDLMAGIQLNPRPRLRLEADLHHFWLVDGGTPLGLEVDLTGTWHLGPLATLTVAYNYFDGSRGLEQITGVRPPYGMAWMQVEVAR